MVESSFDKDLAITSAWLENGVRVHHRFMDYKKDSIMVSIALAGGEIEETAENSGVTDVATLAVDEAATSKFTSGQIRDFMTGKNMSVSAAGMDDSVAITVAGSPVDLEHGLQLAHALLIDGRIEESAFKNWKLASLQRLEQSQRQPQYKAMEALAQLVSNNDPRRIPSTKATLEALALEAGQKWFDRLRREAPIEVAMVGDLPFEKAMPLIERYVGSLSKRPRKAEHLKVLRQSPRPAGPLSRRVEVATVTPQAVALTGFGGAEGRNTKDARAMGIAANVLTSRLRQRLREDHSIVYSVSAQHAPAWVYADSSQFQTGAPCAPENADKVIAEANKIFAEFAEN